jgi:ComF family protein
MSIFPAALSVRLPKKAARASPWPQDCVLCLAAADDALCARCEAALPWIGEACERCALPLPGGGVCGACAVRPPLFDDARACLEYRFPLDRLVQRFKFAGDLAIGRWLAARMARHLRDAKADVIVVPPLARARLRERGFNQALELAKPFARALDIRLAPAALVRVRETQPQPGLRRAERARNLRGGFRCEARVHDLHVAIVDDVLTTGATGQELARVLKEAGALRVSVWVLARTPAPA